MSSLNGTKQQPPNFEGHTFDAQTPLFYPNINDHAASNHGAERSMFSEEKRMETHMKVPWTDIMLATSVITLPMLVLPAVLLGLVFSNRVTQNPGLSPDLALPAGTNPNDQNAYLVRFSSTKLTTVASWTSTVAPMLPTFVMTLLSFPVARRVLKGSNNRLSRYLPTPFQMGLYLKLQDGCTSSLFDCVKYRFWSRREKLVTPLRLAVSGLFAVMLIGYCIFATDTWLHIVTSTVSFTLITPPPSAEVTIPFGRGLNMTMCSPAGLNGDSKCNVNIAGTNTFLNGAREAALTLNNVSTRNFISSYTDNSSTSSSTTIGKGRTFHFLTSSEIDRDTDFQATSIGVSTSCTPISQKCDLQQESGAATLYNCSSGFAGNANLVASAQAYSGSGLDSRYFFDANLSQPLQFKYNEQDTLAINPIHSAHVAYLQSVRDSNDGAAQSLSNDPEIVKPMHGGDVWILGCESTVADVTFTWCNQTVTNMTFTPANASLGALLLTPMLHNFSSLDLQVAAHVADLAPTSQELADAFASAISREMIGLNAGIMASRSNLQEQQRSTFLVTRVPFAPLYFLVALTLIYAVVGVLLAVAAFGSTLRETKEVQARLTVAAVVAEAFEEPARVKKGVEQVKDMFAEREGPGVSRRVGVARTKEGGWGFELH